ncbi:MAG: hypothetical protein JWM32_2938 [Verrucomicrobia bacterium]|nr:hypothetical protein [Verrucomicrobiota bacterium]
MIHPPRQVRRNVAIDVVPRIELEDINTAVFTLRDLIEPFAFDPASCGLRDPAPEVLDHLGVLRDKIPREKTIAMHARTAKFDLGGNLLRG